MAKKDIEKAIKEAHEAADKAIDEVQEDIQDATTSVLAWLKTERTYTQAEILVVALGAIATLVVVSII